MKSYEPSTPDSATSDRAYRLADRPASDSRTRRALERLSSLPINFDRSGPDELSPGNGWNVDHRTQQLPAEPPGPPVAEGSWEIARRLMGGYEFADPSIVRAYYDPEAPLEGRNMLLEIRFLGLRFYVGTRVTRVYEETRRLDGRSALVWGWSYATLEGHLERGEMSWEVRKWVDSGAVEFVIAAYSRRARIRNPLVRLGFMLFGRREQQRFYDVTCRRMRRLTEEALGAARPGEAARQVAEQLTVRPAEDTALPHEAPLARKVDSAAEGG